VPEIRFTADTHPELMRQVRVWLESADEERSVADVVDMSADLTKDALRIVASAAPETVAESDVMGRLTDLGYKATDLSRDTWLAGLDQLARVTDGQLVKRVGEGGAKAAYEMNANVARQLLKSVLRG
jgi:hypothetical protein